ncbi:hypothetical protein TYRP_006188 [Tyrophagus putrescentiae]|nr:hypothetical protein TYRP_006188 [Tyrophagus putrescentiae]
MDVEQAAAALAKQLVTHSIDEEEESETEDEDSLDVDTLLERAEERRRRQKVTSPSAGADHGRPLAAATTTQLSDGGRAVPRRPEGRQGAPAGSLTLRSCRRFAVDRALSPELYRAVVNHTDCGRHPPRAPRPRRPGGELACEFEAILMRYDCAAEWSRWRCEDCQVSRFLYIARVDTNKYSSLDSLPRLLCSSASFVLPESAAPRR